MAFLAELGSKPALGNRHAYRIATSLAERAGSGFRSWDETKFRMARCLRTPLPKLLDIVKRKIVAGQVQQGVEQHACVTVRENEAIAAGPMRIPRIVAQIAIPQCECQWGKRHRGSRMSAIRLLHRIH